MDRGQRRLGAQGVDRSWSDAGLVCRPAHGIRSAKLVGAVRFSSVHLRCLHTCQYDVFLSFSCLSLSVCSTAPRRLPLHAPAGFIARLRRASWPSASMDASISCSLFVLSALSSLRFSLFIRQLLALRFSARPLLYAPLSLHLILPARPPTHLLFCARFRPFTPQRSGTGSWFCTGKQCAALVPFCSTYGTEPHQRRLQTTSGAGRRFPTGRLAAWFARAVRFFASSRVALRSLFASVLPSCPVFALLPSAPDHPLVWCGQPAPPLLLAHVCFSRRERCCALPPPLIPTSFLSLPPHLVVHASSAAVSHGHWQRGRRVRPHRDVWEGGARGNESSASFSFWCSAQPPAGLLMGTPDERQLPTGSRTALLSLLSRDACPAAEQMSLDSCAPTFNAFFLRYNLPLPSVRPKQTDRGCSFKISSLI